MKWLFLKKSGNFLSGIKTRLRWFFFLLFLLVRFSLITFLDDELTKLLSWLTNNNNTHTAQYLTKQKQPNNWIWSVNKYNEPFKHRCNWQSFQIWCWISWELIVSKRWNSKITLTKTFLKLKVELKLTCERCMLKCIETISAKQQQ